MPPQRKPRLHYIGDVFPQGREPFLLEAAVFGGEVAVGFGVARGAFFVVAGDVRMQGS